MSEVVQIPYEQLSEHMAVETVKSIMRISDPEMFYERMKQVIGGAIFEAIHVGLHVADAHDAEGPAELLTAYNAGYAEAIKDQRK